MKKKKHYYYLEDLIIDMKEMDCYSDLYQTIKKELLRQKHWKDKPRGRHDASFFLGDRRNQE